MKKIRTTEKWAVLITVAFGLLIIAALLLCNALTHARYSSAEFYAAYVSKHTAELTEIAQQAMVHADLVKTPEEIRSAPVLEEGNIVYVEGRDDCAVLYIDFAYAPPEGYLRLCYCPVGEYTFPYDDPEWLLVETGKENVLRWEQDMLGRVSWVESTRLNDFFFLERAFLPT